MKKKNLFWIVGLLTAWLLLTGCGGDTGEGTVSIPDLPPAHSQQQQEDPPVQDEQAPQEPDVPENVIGQSPQPDPVLPEKEETVLPAEGSSFAVHYLDVGQGDSVLS